MGKANFIHFPFLTISWIYYPLPSCLNGFIFPLPHHLVVLPTTVALPMGSSWWRQPHHWRQLPLCSPPSFAGHDISSKDIHPSLKSQLPLQVLSERDRQILQRQPPLGRPSPLQHSLLLCTHTYVCTQKVAKLIIPHTELFLLPLSHLSWCERVVCVGNSFQWLPCAVGGTLAVFPGGCWGLHRLGVKKRD